MNREMESICSVVSVDASHREPHYWLFVLRGGVLGKVLVYITHTQTREVLHSSMQVQGQEFAKCFRLVSCKTGRNLQGDTQKLVTITELPTAVILSKSAVNEESKKMLRCSGKW